MVSRRNQVDPSEVLAVTFTNKAADGTDAQPAGLYAAMSPRVRTFGLPALELLRRYEEHLRTEGCVGFNDMLHEAADALESGRASADFRFHQVLVDEFQDLSPAMARLLVALRRLGVPCDGDDGVSLVSAHKAKGTERPAVVIMDVSEDLYGFPSQVEDPDVLAPVGLSQAHNSIEAERRGFFVALTGTEDALHLVVREGKRSRSLREIEGEDRDEALTAVEALDVGTRFTAPLLVERLFDRSHRQRTVGIAQSGILRSRIGTIGFTSWERHRPPVLKAGRCYQFEGLRWDKPYRGQPKAVLDSATTVKELDPPPRGLRASDGPEELWLRERRSNARDANERGG